MSTKLYLTVLLATAAAFPTEAMAQRKPLVAKPLVSLSHQPTGTRLRYDPAEDRYVEYQVQGRIDFVPATGDFLLSWNGVDGSRQTVTWVPPNKITATLTAEVELDTSSGLYTYTYTVLNSSSSRQRIRTVYLGGATPESVLAPDDSWYSRPLSDFLKDTFSLSGGWAWSQTREPLGIAPGSTVSGFKLVSRNPPSVIRCFAAGAAPNLSVREEPPAELHAAINSAYYRLPEGFTVGPTPAPFPADAQADLERLLSDLDQAREQGWLGPLAAASQILAVMDEVRSSVLAGRLTVARDGIEGILDVLSRGNFPDMPSEGRTLLLYRLPLLHAKIGGQR
jgi:hypothetical protein